MGIIFAPSKLSKKNNHLAVIYSLFLTQPIAVDHSRNILDLKRHNQLITIWHHWNNATWYISLYFVISIRCIVACLKLLWSWNSAAHVISWLSLTVTKETAPYITVTCFNGLLTVPVIYFLCLLLVTNSETCALYKI